MTGGSSFREAGRTYYRIQTVQVLTARRYQLSDSCRCLSASWWWFELWGVPVDIFQKIQDVFLWIGWIWAIKDKGSKEWLWIICSKKLNKGQCYVLRGGKVKRSMLDAFSLKWVLGSPGMMLHRHLDLGWNSKTFLMGKRIWMSST